MKHLQSPLMNKRWGLGGSLQYCIYIIDQLFYFGRDSVQENCTDVICRKAQTAQSQLSLVREQLNEPNERRMKICGSVIPFDDMVSGFLRYRTAW